MPTAPAPGARRPLTSRDTRWAAAATRGLVRARIRPNWISLASVAFAGVAGAAFWRAGGADTGAAVALYLIAAAGIQLRLVCNLLDGMVAVEGRMGGPLGELYNDLPDRVADSLIILGVGYGLVHLSFGVELGWLAALIACLTAYVRVLGVAAGARPQFCGPLAKPHRMAVLTVAALLAVGERLADFPPRVLAAALAVIVLGCVVTIARRLRLIAADLRLRPKS